MTTTTATATLYTEVTGTTAILADQRGTVTGLHTHPAHGTLGAFVRLDGPVDAEGRYIAPGAMLYVTLGARVGERGERHEVTGWRVINRDEFDRILELDTLRADLGWK